MKSKIAVFLVIICFGEYLVSGFPSYIHSKKRHAVHSFEGESCTSSTPVTLDKVSTLEPGWYAITFPRTDVVEFRSDDCRMKIFKSCDDVNISGDHQFIDFDPKVSPEQLGLRYEVVVAEVTKSDVIYMKVEPDRESCDIEVISAVSQFMSDTIKIIGNEIDDEEEGLLVTLGSSMIAFEALDKNVISIPLSNFRIGAPGERYNLDSAEDEVPPEMKSLFRVGKWSSIKSGIGSELFDELEDPMKSGMDVIFPASLDDEVILTNTFKGSLTTTPTGRQLKTKIFQVLDDSFSSVIDNLEGKILYLVDYGESGASIRSAADWIKLYLKEKSISDVKIVVLEVRTGKFSIEAWDHFSHKFIRWMNMKSTISGGIEWHSIFIDVSLYAHPSWLLHTQQFFKKFRKYEKFDVLKDSTLKQVTNSRFQELVNSFSEFAPKEDEEEDYEEITSDYSHHRRDVYQKGHKHQNSNLHHKATGWAAHLVAEGRLDELFARINK